MTNRETKPAQASRTTAELGFGAAFEFVDAESGPRLSPRGLLPTPPEVQDELKGEQGRLKAMTPRARQRFRDDLNLSYYFAGQTVAYRFTDQGVEILAVGQAEIAALRARLCPTGQLGIVEEQVRAWPE